MKNSLSKKKLINSTKHNEQCCLQKFSLETVCKQDVSVPIIGKNAESRTAIKTMCLGHLHWGITDAKGSSVATGTKCCTELSQNTCESLVCLSFRSYDQTFSDTGYDNALTNRIWGWIRSLATIDRKYLLCKSFAVQNPYHVFDSLCQKLRLLEFAQ